MGTPFRGGRDDDHDERVLVCFFAVHAQNVCYRVHSGKDECKEVLHSVSASMPVGSLCVVLGPSGAGKSSLFDVLMGMEDGEVHAGYVPHNRRIVYVRQVGDPGARTRTIWVSG